MAFKECIEISAYNRLDKYGVYCKGALYIVDNQRATLIPNNIDSSVKDALEDYHEGKTSRRCSCVARREITLSLEDSTDIFDAHVRQVSFDEMMWSKALQRIRASPYSKLAEKYLVYGIDRSNYLEDAVTDFYRCGVPGCLCAQCWIDHKDERPQWVVDNWLYLREVLHAKTKHHGPDSTLRASIDPWSLHTLWYCKRCFDYNIVEVTDDEAKPYKICLRCADVKNTE